MKHAVEMASGGMICIPSLIKIGSSVQKLEGEYIQTHTPRQQGELISLLLLLKNKESRLQNVH
jgi:hypothetical protein